MTKTTNYRRLTGVKVTGTTRPDKNDWVGIKTESHGEIRCKAKLKTKLKLKKGWKGPLTVGNYGNEIVVAFDQFAHEEVSSHWNILDESLFDPTHYGFIYGVTNNLTGRRYIGRRFFHSGNWKNYTTSSRDVNADIEKYGKENFTFDIWYTCEMRGDLVYLEVKEQMDNDVLTAKMDNGDRAYYNKAIGAIKFIPPEKHSEATKKFLSEKTKKDWQDPEFRAKMANRPRPTKQQLSDGGRAGGITRGKQLATAIIGTKDGNSTYFVSQSDASRKLGIPQGNINHALAGRRKTAGGYQWRYNDND